MKKLLFLCLLLAAACTQVSEDPTPEPQIVGGDAYWTIPNETPVYEYRVPNNAAACTDPIYYKPKMTSRTNLSWPPSAPSWLGGIVTNEIRPYNYYSLPALAPTRFQYNMVVQVQIRNAGKSTVKMCVGNGCLPSDPSAQVIPPGFSYYIYLPVQQGSCVTDQPVIQFYYTYYMYYCGTWSNTAPVGYVTNLQTDVYTAYVQGSPSTTMYWDSVTGSDGNEFGSQWLTQNNCPTYPGMP